MTLFEPWIFVRLLAGAVATLLDCGGFCVSASFFRSASSSRVTESGVHS